MQFLVFQAGNTRKASHLMDMICDISQQRAITGHCVDDSTGPLDSHPSFSDNYSKRGASYAVESRANFSDCDLDDEGGRSQAPWMEEDWSHSDEGTSLQRRLLRRPIRGHRSREKVQRRKVGRSLCDKTQDQQKIPRGAAMLRWIPTVHKGPVLRLVGVIAAGIVCVLLLQLLLRTL